MKAIYKIYLLGIALMLMGVSFTACVDELVRDASPEDTATGTQAYFSENNEKSMAFLPDDDTVFSIEIGRRNATGAFDLPLQIIDEKGVFLLEDTVKFAAGESLKEVEVDFSAMDLGMEADLIISLDPEDATIYGNSTLTISVLRDYKWIDRGSVTFTDNAFGFGDGPVQIQQAEKLEIFRLLDPYNTFEEELLDDGDDPLETGYSFVFSLDTTKVGNYKLKSIAKGTQDIGMTQWSVYGIYYDPENYPDYCYLKTNGNSYTAGILFYDVTTGGLVAGIPLEFTWDVDFPGELPDPYEGDATVNLDWTMSSAEVSYWGYEGYSYEIEDQYGSADYAIVDEFEIALSGSNGDIVLSLLTDYVGGELLPTGEYPINASDKENTMRAGFKAGEPDGSYVEVPSIGATLYLTEGKVEIAEADDVYTIQIEGKSALGSEIKASWTGSVSIIDQTAEEDEDEPAGVKAQAKIKRLQPGKKLPIIRK